MAIKESIREEQAPDSLWEAVPGWLLILGGGIFTILAASLAASVYFHVRGGHRAFWATIELLAGSSCVIVAHTIASRAAVRGNRRLTLLDVVSSPILIWQPAVDNLPQTRGRIYSAAWGLTAVFSATMIIGGIDYLSLTDNLAIEYEPRGNKLIKMLATALHEEAMYHLIPEQVLQDDGTMECVVFGYLPDGPGTLGRVLFGSNILGEMVHMATLHEEEIPEEDRRRIRALTREHVRLKPAIACKFWATRVDPTVKVRLGYDKVADGRTLVGVRFQGMADKKTTKVIEASRPVDVSLPGMGVLDPDGFIQQARDVEEALGE